MYALPALTCLGLSLLLLQAKPKAPTNPESLRPQIAEAIDSLEVITVDKPKKVLIFSVTKGYRHRSIPTGKLAFKMLGERTGAFEAVISDDLSNFEPENIDQFGAICFLNTTNEVFSPHSKRKKVKLTPEEEQEWTAREARLKESMMRFIKSGKGFIGIHAATDTFYQWPEYGEMIGAYFAGHPWTQGTLVHVNAPNPNNKLISYLNGESLELKEEIYQYKSPLNEESADVILKLDPHKNSFAKAIRPEEKNNPVSWTKAHGNGRVFYSCFGHNDHVYYHPKILQHYLNGIQWALGDSSL